MSPGAPAREPGDAAQRLESARRRIDQLDDELVRVAAERVAAAAEAGRAKAQLGQSLVDFQRERDVMDRVRAAAQRHGLDATVAEDLVVRLVLASTSRQESDRLAAAATGRGRQAVVVGGAGRMGRWLVRFLQGAGYQAHVLDPAQPSQQQAAASLLPTADLVLLAVPPSQVSKMYDSWCAAPPRGVVADLCSVKSPVLPALRRLAAAGARVGSFHPMFGPSTTVLRGSDVVLCRTGDAQAEATLRSLFAPTSARLVEVDLEQHDRLMAEVLTLAHATAIAFAASLDDAPPGTQSTTFRKLRDVAVSVVVESPQVYYEIQSGNPHSEAALARLESTVAHLRRLVAAKDADGFRRLLEQGKERLSGGAAGGAR